MTTRTELVRRLEAIGEVRAPEPTPRFVDELEQRLLHDLDDVEALPAAAPRVDRDPARAWAGPRRTLTTMSGVAAALVLVVGIVLATVQDATTRVATPWSPTPTEPVPAADAPDASGDTAEVEAGDRDDTYVRGGDARDESHGSAGASSGDTAGGAETAPDGRATAGPAPPPGGWRYNEPSEARFLLEAKPTAAAAELTWERYDGDDFFAYVVLRARDDDPEYPRDRGNGAKTQFVYRSESRQDTTWSDTDPRVAGETRYLVVVFDETGRELARSNVAAVTASVGINITNLL